MYGRFYVGPFFMFPCDVDVTRTKSKQQKRRRHGTMMASKDAMIVKINCPCNYGWTIKSHALFEYQAILRGGLCYRTTCVLPVLTHY